MGAGGVKSWGTGRPVKRWGVGESGSSGDEGGNGMEK